MTLVHASKCSLENGGRRLGKIKEERSLHEMMSAYRYLGITIRAALLLALHEK